MKHLTNSLLRRRSGKQRGFTMVELAVVLVVAGLILVAVLKGTDTINKAKAERAVADLRGLQGMIVEYQKRNNRLPGDCNNDGKIGFTPNAGISLTTLLDITEGNRILPKTLPTSWDVTSSCDSLTAEESHGEVLWNDLRRNNSVDPQRLPGELSKNSNGSFYSVGNMTGTGSDNANVIVVYDIPIWMAEAIDVSIDGVTQYSAGTSAATTGRVRRWDINGGAAFVAASTYVNGYAAKDETRDSLISISYQFDVNKLPN